MTGKTRFGFVETRKSVRVSNFVAAGILRYEKTRTLDRVVIRLICWEVVGSRACLVVVK